MSMNVKPSKRYRILLILLAVTIFIKLFSFQPSWVEKYYSSGLFRFISGTLRILTGWIPFSLGDILYILVIIWIIRVIIRFSALLFKRKLSWRWFKNTIYRSVIIFLWVYVIFNSFWGINYNRKSISSQLGIYSERSDTFYLSRIGELLLQKLNTSKQALINERSPYPDNKEIFRRAEACYQKAVSIYPFLDYHSHSLKSSLFGWWGNYFGFTG